MNSMDRRDILIAAALALLLFIVLLAQLGAPGVTWDEVAPSFPNAKNQAYWLSHLFSLESPFSQETIDQYWESASDHPSLPRTIAAVSYLLFGRMFDEIVALRIPSALKFSLLVGSIFLFLRLRLPRFSSLAGALSLALMPRLFGHAHFYSLDMPITCWWFWTAALGYLALLGKVWPGWFVLAYAIAFTTKLHAVFLPFPFAAWALYHIIFVEKNNLAVWKRAGWMALGAAIVTPLFYVALQPWLWHDTVHRVAERFLDYAEKSSARPIPLFYLGTTYYGDSPWHYPLVMILFTLPAVILFFYLFGLVSVGWPRYFRAGENTDDRRAWIGYWLFFVLHFLTPMMLVLLPLAQAYDGVRLFLPCFPFAACLVGLGFHLVQAVLRQSYQWSGVKWILMALLIVPSLFSYLNIHPYYLAYYNEMAGGIAGAQRKGMETTYWCDAFTRDFVEKLNDRIRPNGRLMAFSMPLELLEYYKQRGWLREDIQIDPTQPEYVLLHFRQGMFRPQVEWKIFYYSPIDRIELDDVPLVGLYYF